MLASITPFFLSLRSSSLLPQNFVDVINDSLPLSWSALILAILVEIFATTHLKLSRDKSSLAGVSLSMLLFNVSLTLFATSLGQIPVSTAYAIWSALGTTAVSFAGITIFGEPCNSLKLVSLLSIMVGVVGLNLADRDDL